MKLSYILFLFIIIILPYAACKKKDTAPTMVAPPTIDSVKVDSAKQVSIYPYTDTYNGQYNESNPDIPPYTYSGTSTITVTHVNKDSITIFALSIGMPHGVSIYASANTNGSDTYPFSVQWYSDRSDRYTCKFINDSIVCNIDQTTGGNFDDYTGCYTGYAKIHSR